MGVSVRVSSLNSVCAICGDVEKTVVHALKDCKLARVIWMASGVERVLDRSFATLGEWWGWMSDEVGAEEWDLFITMIWAVWGARNKWVMARVIEEVSEVCGYARRVWSEDKELVDAPRKTEKKEGGGEVSMAGWKCPDSGWIKLNVDAGVKGGCGTVLGIV